MKKNPHPGFFTKNSLKLLVGSITCLTITAITVIVFTGSLSTYNNNLKKSFSEYIKDNDRQALFLKNKDILLNSKVETLEKKVASLETLTGLSSQHYLNDTLFIQLPEHAISKDNSIIINENQYTIRYPYHLGNVCDINTDSSCTTTTETLPLGNTDDSNISIGTDSHGIFAIYFHGADVQYYGGPQETRYTILPFLIVKNEPGQSYSRFSADDVSQIKDVLKTISQTNEPAKCLFGPGYQETPCDTLLIE